MIRSAQAMQPGLNNTFARKKQYMKRPGGILTALLFATNLIAQQAPVNISTTSLKKDFSIFRAALTEAHPGLYTYHDSSYWTKRFKETAEQLTHPLTELAFYRLLAPLVADIKCGHTKWHRNGHPEDLYAFYQTGLFPLKLYFRDAKAYVVGEYRKTNIPQGAEIIGINNNDMATVAARLKTNIPADGVVESARRQMLGEQFAGYYASFIGPSFSFTINYRLKNGTVKTTVVPSVDVATIRNHNTPATHDTLSVSFPAKGVALMRIPVFMPQEGGPEWESFLATAFHRIRQANAESLILDLRNNEGGIDQWGARLFAWFTDKPFRYYNRLTVVSDRDFSFRQYASLPEQYDQLKAFIKKQGNEYIFTLHPNLDIQQPQQDPFKGKLYVLINGRSFSVTSEFAAIARDQHRAVFVGEESGGTIEGNNSGGFVIVKLPNTGLTLGIPLLRYHMSLNEKYPLGRGIIPDHIVASQPADIIKGKDAVLEKTLSLIRDQGK
ncbi:Peptidase family S41 [Chitinophaga terrae (ex Kim and Jung 2007)]|uniref:Peptidase family S41 n=2 Tax=Chitinophaga terrae (ex Kim and Jung 2007) TaxID=408074 RepID=A0A1H4D6C9_9BACT|nr:peptidase S41 [Chitinophaga terrae (ex Kim and Jung 2007)]SEA68118.1 Peptidase family S41 [Chitinophaga terrae (ex Kim and Jung 2007)]